jgi:CHAT domain-containing protein/tetratricopeptide (TPR) repeat protein
MGAGGSGAASAAEDENLMTQEHFVQQAAGEALLIKIDAFEAEFESRLLGPDGEVLLVSGLPGSRIAPLFQYVQPPGKTRQLDIELASGSFTQRSEFSIELTRLTVWDERSNAVSHAYQLLSFGMQSGDSGSAANWTVKIESLSKAGKLFQQFGMTEMRSWANYLTAHLIYHHLHDYSMVYSLTREILTELKGARLQKIELATLQLQGAALIGLVETGALQTSADRPDPVQAVLARTAELARMMDFQYEQALASSTSAARHAAASRYTEALEQFQKAVEIADRVGDAALEKSIREDMLSIHALQGNVSASSEVLQEIETQLTGEGDGDELALNLLAQGRLLIQHYRYNQALETLGQALRHQNNSSIQKQIEFELAGIFYQAGRLEDSMAYLELAGISPDSDPRKRTSPVLDYGEALRMMANIYRAREEFGKMRQARGAQGQYQTNQAKYFYEQGLDNMATSTTGRQRARALFAQSREAAVNSGDMDMAHLSLLQYCVLGGGAETQCSGQAINSSYQWLLSSGIPRYACEAMYLWAQVLENSGRATEAITVMGRLTDEIHFLRHSVPGVLGAWYGARHEALYDFYLRLPAANAGQGSGVDDSESLLALSKIRLIGTYSDFDTGPGDTELLRTRLAQRANSGPGRQQRDLAAEIKQNFAELRSSFNDTFSYLSSSGLQQHLRSLAGDEMLLTYHVGAGSAQAWVAHKGRVKRLTMANPAALNANIQAIQEDLEHQDLAAFDSRMDALGRSLLEPVSDLLTRTIYWIPAGPLLGIPLDAIRLKGHYLVERHSVINLMSFPENVSPSSSLRPGLLEKVFLAGHPVDYSSDYATRIDTSEDIRAIADMFVGPGLDIVQGAALLPDEFQVERFRRADLIHLAMPGIIDLKYPEQSNLELSQDEFSPQRTLLWAEDIRPQRLDAGLVFLSATRIANQPLSWFGSRMGLVTDFLEVGADSVIAASWGSGGKAGLAFVTDFYDSLESSVDISESLAQAKRRHLKANRETGLYDWAAYQLFID